MVIIVQDPLSAICEWKYNDHYLSSKSLQKSTDHLSGPWGAELQKEQVGTGESWPGYKVFLWWELLYFLLVCVFWSVFVYVFIFLKHKHC